MPVSHDKIMAMTTTPVESTYTDREVMLYALGVGFGRDPMNEAELPFVYEKNLRTVPTMAAVMAQGSGSLLGSSGLNFVMLVHGEQRLTLDRPLPPAATIVSQGRVAGFFDKGKDKGAILLTETEIRLKDTKERLCTLGSTLFFRGDGGFGGPAGSGPAPHPIPERKPDAVLALETRIDQALLYRLCGDRNPLHSDPDFARAAGFPRPILHGLCSYGTACRAVLQEICGFDHSRVRGFDVRFSSPVFPGETIVTEMWKDGNIVSFRARLKERDVLVLNNGKCTLTA